MEEEKGILIYHFYGEDSTLKRISSTPNLKNTIDSTEKTGRKSVVIDRFYKMDDGLIDMEWLIKSHLYKCQKTKGSYIYELVDLTVVDRIFSRTFRIINQGLYPKKGMSDKELRKFVILMLGGLIEDDDYLELKKKQYPLISESDLISLESRDIEYCVKNILKPAYIKEYGLDNLLYLIYEDSKVVRNRLRFDFSLCNQDYEDNFMSMLNNKHILELVNLYGIFRRVEDYKVYFWKGNFSIGFNLYRGYEIGTEGVNGYLEEDPLNLHTVITDKGEFEIKGVRKKYKNYYYNDTFGTVAIIVDFIKMMLFSTYPTPNIRRNELVDKPEISQ